MRLPLRWIKERLPPRLRVPALAARHWLSGEPEIRLLSRLVSRERAAVDVGANDGIYTYFLSRLSPRVLAFEPWAELARMLASWAPRHVQVHDCALSDTEGEGELRVPVLGGRARPGLASLARDSRPASDGEAIRCPVRTRRLDDLAPDDVGFVKIDVEGGEERVLRGGEALLRRSRPTLLVEIEQRHHARPIAEVFDYLRSLGYAGRFLRDGRLCPISDFSIERHQQPAGSRRRGAYVNNFVFLPEEGPESLD